MADQHPTSSSDSEKKGITNIKDCHLHTKCIEVMTLILDKEADQDQLQFFEGLDKCEACKRRFELEKNIKFAIQNKIPKSTVPEDLLKKIRSLPNGS